MATAITINEELEVKEGWSISEKLLFYLLRGKTASGKQILPVTDASAALTVPSDAYSAIIVIIAHASAVRTDDVARFWEDGSIPTAAQGLVLGDRTPYEIKGRDNLSNFKIIGVDAGLTHSLQIQYYR